jgi:hypothetical protein
MNKEKELKFESGYSEKEMDLAVDKSKNYNQVKAVNIFDSKNKDKKKSS